MTVSRAIASRAAAVWLRLSNTAAAYLFLAWPDETIGKKRARIEACFVALAFANWNGLSAPSLHATPRNAK
jgi:hypothetical protein